MKQGDLVRFKRPANEYERNALFVVIEDRDSRMAVRDVTTKCDGELLQRSWTVYATADLEVANV
jgi:hypothetical protein